MLTRVYLDQIDAWHARRVSTLNNDYGWLTIVGLEWLKEGTNTVQDIGTISLQGGKVNVSIADGLSGTLGGKQFKSGSIRTEADAKGPDRVKVGSKAFAILKRGDRFAVRMWDTNAERRRSFRGITRFPVSEQWRIEATWEEYKKPKRLKLPTVLPRYVEEYNVPGLAVFNFQGSVIRLEAILEEGSQELCFAFADLTSGHGTYAGGRYVYASPAEHGSVVLDFNKAINPPCAFTPFATSPLAPNANRLNIIIEAGELAYTLN